MEVRAFFRIIDTALRVAGSFQWKLWAESFFSSFIPCLLRLMPGAQPPLVTWNIPDPLKIRTLVPCSKSIKANQLHPTPSQVNWRHYENEYVLSSPDKHRGGAGLPPLPTKATAKKKAAAAQAKKKKKKAPSKVTKAAKNDVVEEAGRSTSSLSLTSNLEATWQKRKASTSARHGLAAQS